MVPKPKRSDGGRDWFQRSDMTQVEVTEIVALLRKHKAYPAISLAFDRDVRRWRNGHTVPSWPIARWLRALREEIEGPKVRTAEDWIRMGEIAAADGRIREWWLCELVKGLTEAARR